MANTDHTRSGGGRVIDTDQRGRPAVMGARDEATDLGAADIQGGDDARTRFGQTFFHVIYILGEMAWLRSPCRAR